MNKETASDLRIPEPEPDRQNEFVSRDRFSRAVAFRKSEPASEAPQECGLLDDQAAQRLRDWQ